MSGVFDSLNKRIGTEDEDAGISPLDLQELAPKVRKLMRYMLREIEVKFDGLRERLAEELADEPFADEELKEALEALVQDGFLIRFGEEKITYEANLRRKRKSQLAVWRKLDSRIEEKRKLRQQGANEPDSKR